MLALRAKIQQMYDAVAVRHQPVGDEGAVAFRGIALRAHDADGIFPLCQRSCRGPEFFRLHVIGVGLAHAAERLAVPLVGNAGLPERGSQSFF